MDLSVQRSPLSERTVTPRAFAVKLKSPPGTSWVRLPLPTMVVVAPSVKDFGSKSLMVPTVLASPQSENARLTLPPSELCLKFAPGEVLISAQSAFVPSVALASISMSNLAIWDGMEPARVASKVNETSPALIGQPALL